MRIEEWRDIPGFSLYQASSEGRVRRIVAGRYRRDRRKLLSAPIGSHGYRVVSVADDSGRRNAKQVHRLVALAFLPAPRIEETDVAHGPGGPLDNRPENIRWATPAGNMADQLRDGTRAVGELHGMSKLTAKAVADIRARYRKGRRPYQRDLAAEYGVARSLISMIVGGKWWKHVD